MSFTTTKPETWREFHVAIVGAGIAGLALAIALHRRGVSFTLYEGARAYSTVGAGIGFAPNGMRTMDLLEPAFRSLYEEVCVGNKGQDAQHIFFEGMIVEQGLGGAIDPGMANQHGATLISPESLQAHRKALLDIMTTFIPIEKVQFNKRLDKIEQRANDVLLNFSDGSTAGATVLAGGDGIQSVAREHVLHDRYPNEVAPVYAGSYCYRAVIPIAEAHEILGDLTDVAKFYFGHGRSVVTYRISGGKEFNFLHCVADANEWPAENGVTQKTTHENMMADFEDPAIDDRIRRLLSLAIPIKWGLFHHLKTSSYFRDRVILLGDSAHASLPFQAAGAAQGLEDALVLSNVLAELAQRSKQIGDECPLTEIRAGVAAYDVVRRPRAQKQLEQSHEVARMIFFQHEEAGADMEKILPGLQNGRFDWLWFHDIEEDVQRALEMMRAELK